MSSVADELFERALDELPADERRRLGLRLYESAEPDDDPREVDEAWAEEIERRMKAYRDGHVKAADSEEVLARLERKLNA
jgi:putative addiction module component (TIGR02574 family)